MRSMIEEMNNEAACEITRDYILKHFETCRLCAGLFVVFITILFMQEALRQAAYNGWQGW